MSNSLFCGEGSKSEPSTETCLPARESASEVETPRRGFTTKAVEGVFARAYCDVIGKEYCPEAEDAPLQFRTCEFVKTTCLPDPTLVVSFAVMVHFALETKHSATKSTQRKAESFPVEQDEIRDSECVSRIRRQIKGKRHS